MHRWGFRLLAGLALVSASALAQPAAPLSDDAIRKAIEADRAANAASQSSDRPGTPSMAAAPSFMPRVFQSLNPDLSFIADFAAAAFMKSGMQKDLQGDHDPSHNGFNLQALEMAVGATVDPYFRFDANIVFGNAGDIEIEEAYGTTLGLPGGLQIRAGKFLNRFGRFNPTHPHTWNFADDPMVLAQFFGGDGNRGLGAEVSELVPFLPWYVELVFSMTDPRGGTTNRSFAADLPTYETDSLDAFSYMGALKQFFPLAEDVSLSWGLSAITAPNAVGHRSEIYGTDVYLKWRPVGQPQPPVISLHSEFLLRRYETGAGILTSTGAFAQLLYRFQPRWAAGVGAEYVTTPSSADANGLLTACYDSGDGLPGPSGPPYCAEGTTTRYKADVTFYPSEFSRLRLQYDVEPPGPTHGHVGHAVFLAVEFAVGAHGAHQF